MSKKVVPMESEGGVLSLKNMSPDFDNDGKVSSIEQAVYDKFLTADTDGDGFLTRREVYKVIASMKKQVDEAGKGGIPIATLNPDSDGDGKVAPWEKDVFGRIQAADADASGSISVKELFGVIKGAAESDKQKKLAYKLLGFAVAVIVLLIGSMLAVSIAAGEMVKESHVDGTRVMTDTTGEAVGMATAIEAHSLWTLPALSVEVLGNTKTLMFYIDMTANPEVGTWSVASTRPTTMYKKSAEKLVLVTSEGFKITVDSQAKVGSIEMFGVSYPIAEEAPPTSRRSLQALMDPEPAEGAPPMRRRRLRRGGLLGGSQNFMTAGSNDNLTGDGR